MRRGNCKLSIENCKLKIEEEVACADQFAICNLQFAICNSSRAGINPAARLPRVNRAARLPRGMVLIVVLVVISLLSLSALTFSQLMLAERRAAEVSAAQARARAAADSGVEMVRLFLVRDREEQNELGGWYDNQRQFGGRLVQYQGDGEYTDPKRFTIIAPNMDDGRYGGLRYGLEDESTRLNLNVLATLDEKFGADAGRGILMGLPGMNEEIADSILDWIDEDDEAREYGAEADYYTANEPAYRPKNGPLETIEELLLVRGVTPDLLFGTDFNRNGQHDPGEPNAEDIENVENIEGEMDRGWSAYLTLYGMELNVTPDGTQRIDLNQDDMEELYNQLEEAISTDAATFIVAYRQQSQPYTGSRRGESFTGGQLDFRRRGRLKLGSVIDLIGQSVSVRFRGQQESTVLEPMFPDVPGGMNLYLPILMDYCTINPEPVIPGRININQAPRIVLAGIPGMEEELLDQIIAARQTNPVDADTNRRHETWILSEGIVPLDKMKELMPFVTGGGSVYRAQVIGYFDRGGPTVRIETVLDATKMPPRLLFYRDLSHLGRGFAPETLGVGLDQPGSGNGG